jgi:quinol monooxygenase YgiN
MAVYVVWETWLTDEGRERGLTITKSIWMDMRQCDGYLGHFLLRDQDDPGHLLLVSLWKTRQAADTTREVYAHHPNITALQPLLKRERSRTVYDLNEINGQLVTRQTE